MRSQIRLFTCGLLLLAAGGCQTTKSSSPTAPTVAGPIPGVTITAPVLIQPAQGFKFKESEQPIQLVIQNATTSGVRALSYTFEVAADTGFNTKVFSRSKVPPGDGGKTAVTLDKLAIGQSYYWRAWADDGANTGAMASSAFMIYPKAVVNAPTPVSPVNNAQVASTTPAMVTGNAATVGPVGFLAYEFQVASDQAFGHLIAAGVVNEGTGGQTTFNSSPLGNGATFFWRVRAADSETTSGWSVTQPFTTPPAAPPPGGGGGGGGGGGTGGNCDSLVNGDRQKLVECIWATVPKPTDEFSAFEVTKRVAWALRGEKAGLLVKTSGENIVPWQGNIFSAGRICYPDGHIYKVIGDVGPGGANTPSWSDNGFVDPSLYVPAIDPSKK
jgi:hypothetical protein